MKQPPPPRLTVLADHREKRSGLPEILDSTGFRVEFATLETGDYLVERKLLIERKTRTDFTASLITGRLFEQCLRMKRSGLPCLLIIEGNPAADPRNISMEAVKGAILTVMITHQIPVYISLDLNGTAALIRQCARQVIKNPSSGCTKRRKPKSRNKKQLHLLMGLPGVGIQLAQRMMEYFGSVENVFRAEINELLKIKGMGKSKAVNILDFIKSKSKYFQCV